MHGLIKGDHGKSGEMHGLLVGNHEQSGQPAQIQIVRAGDIANVTIPHDGGLARIPPTHRRKIDILTKAKIFINQPREAEAEADAAPAAAATSS